MKRGAIVNLLIGITIALLPLYNRVCQIDMQRTSKDNLLVIIFGFLAFLLPNSVRRMSVVLYAALIYGLFFLIFNQWHVASLSVIMQCFYIGAGLCFFAAYYERHDQGSIHFILKGMMAGSLIQGIIAILGYYGIEIYPIFASFFSQIDNIVSLKGGKGNVVGSLGNNNLLASYIAITSLAWLSSKKKILIIIPVIALFLADSFTANISFIGGVFYFYRPEIVKKWQIYSLSIMAMLIYPFSGIGHDSGRIYGWTKIINMASLKHWLIGVGPGWLSDQKIMLTDGTFLAQEHNSYLSVFNVYGLAGIALLAIPFIKFIKSNDSHKILASVLFVAFLNSYAHFTSHQSTVVIVIIVTSCICMAKGNTNGIDLERECDSN